MLKLDIKLLTEVTITRLERKLFNCDAGDFLPLEPNPAMVKFDEGEAFMSIANIPHQICVTPDRTACESVPSAEMPNGAASAEDYQNSVFFGDSRKMSPIPDNSIHLIVTSPPYFNIKDYSLDGYQQTAICERQSGQIGDISVYDDYITEMLKVWKECERVLKPNGKLVINTPLMPRLKAQLNTHYNRDIFNIDSDIQHSIRTGTGLYLLDIYIWNRTNSSKKLMFGSYPYPRNFYAQNTTEFVTVYVKDGHPERADAERKEASRLTQEEWVEFTTQVWNIPIPNKNDLAFGTHSALMPEEIVRRCVKLYTFVGDTVLDPFAGSGTTLRVAKQLNRKYVGFEISPAYKQVIDLKLEDELHGNQYSL